MCRRLLAFLTLLAVAPCASAQIGVLSTSSDEWLNKPYRLSIQLHVDEHPLMTPAFRSGLLREVRDTLQGDLGQVCDIEISDQASATMKEIAAKGWGALDRTHLINEQKTHYVRVRFLEGGQFELEARQVDGYTGLVSSRRKAQTTDRQWVARQIALMIGQDFGMVGVAKEINGKTVRVLLKGAKLGEPDSIRIQAGEVLAISEMRLLGGRLSGTLQPHAILYVTGVQSGQGEATARLFKRFGDTAKMERVERGVQGFRVIKLGTGWAPLRLRIIDSKTKDPIPGISVSIARGGFETGQDVALGATDAQGRISSTEVFRNIAFVWISQGGVTRSPLPLPLLDDGVIEFRLAGTQEAARLVEFNIVYNSWLRRLTEANVVFDGKIRLIKELFAKGKEREAIVEGNELHTRMVEDATSLRDGLSKLQDQAGESGEIAKGKAALAAKQLERFTQQLSGFEEQLKEWEDPSPAARKVREGRIHEQTPDPVAAIEAYKEALKLDPSRAVASKRLKILQEAWEKKDPKLLEARTYIFETWPTITDSDQMELQLGKITDAIKAIKQHGDYVTALKLYRANVAHRERLLGIRQQLQPDVKDIDAAIEKQIDGLVEKINEMNDTALDLVEKSR